MKIKFKVSRYLSCFEPVTGIYINQMGYKSFCLDDLIHCEWGPAKEESVSLAWVLNDKTFARVKF